MASPIEISGAAAAPPQAAPASVVGRVHVAEARRLSLAGLAAVLFCSACGGAFGLEPLVGAVGPGWAIVLILVMPFLWSVPVSLMVAELSSMMPEEGGYYVWVRSALGPFWGVQEAVWTLGYSVILMAIFPVMFVNYVAYFVPALAVSGPGPVPWATELLRWLVAVAVVVSSLLVNWRGAKSVGRSSELATGLILGSFAVLAALGLASAGAWPAAVAAVRQDLASGQSGTLLLGLSIIIFNYSGWDNGSTVAGEVKDAGHAYPRALALALVATVLVYLLPVLAGIGHTVEASAWSAEEGWPAIGALIGGPWLGALMAGAALVSSWSLYNSNLLYASRLPYVLACDGWLPRGLARASSENGVPTTALAWCAAFSAVFAAASFGNLVVMFVLIYSAALFLEFLSLAVLRVRRPGAARTFRVPGGWFGVLYVCLAPLFAAGAVLIASFREQEAFLVQLLLVVAILASGVATYVLRRRKTLEASG